MSEDVEPTYVQMPPEPCVVISDGEKIVVATDRTCEQVRQFGAWGGPVTRATTAARLRAFADIIESATQEPM